MNDYQSANQKLPTFGIGPYLILSIIVLSVLGIVFSQYLLPGGKVKGPFSIIFDLIGIGLIFGGFILWYLSAVKSDFNECVVQNRLKTTGVFALTRNPMYTGWWFLLLGVLLFWHDFWLFLLIPLHWIILTIVLRRTEERWLYQVYGQEYIDYCYKVNRLVPVKFYHLQFKRRGIR